MLAAPFVYASAAAALDAEVEMHFAGRAVRLLVAGEAAKLRSLEYGGEPIEHFLRQAVDGGVKLIACSSAHGTHVKPGERMVEGYSGAAGAAAFAQRALDPEWRTLVF